MGAGRSCPTCGERVEPRASNRAFPFCSDRCRLLDLGNWLGETYRIPAGMAGDGAVAAAPDEADDEG